MTDDLDKLAALLRDDMPAPSDAAKRAAISAGMAAFEKNSEKFQGTAPDVRPIHNRSDLGRGFMEGLKAMFNKLTGRQMMLGTASLATIAFAVVMIQNTKPPHTGPRSPIIEQTDPTPEPFDPTANVPTQGDLGPQDSEMGYVPRPEPDPEVNSGPAVLAVPQEGGESAANVDLTPASPAPTGKADDAAGSGQGAAVLAEDMADTPVPAAPPASVVTQAPQAERSRNLDGAVLGGVIGQVDAAAGAVAPYESPITDTEVYQPPVEGGHDQFAGEAVSPLKVTQVEPVSTFSIDVDTASYAFVRRSLLNGYLPDPAAVRTEEMINYFNYDYATPQSDEAPFAPQASVFPTPWNPDTLLMHIGIQGYDIPASERPPVNLVFLIDTSGSMNDPQKLPLLIQSFRLLLGELNDHDQVAIVTYAGSAGVVLEPTPATEVRKILNSLMRLGAGGSTAGQAGLQQAYALAEEMADDGDTSRVILATDGDFNVGISDRGELQKYIEAKRETGVYLSILGFGQGNYNDALMQTLAQNGNGTAAYIDTLAEAQKVLVDQIGGALFTIAQDVKIQVEFNPAEVAEYRLIGYETRALNREDFNNDSVDAGDIGAGTQVTAIYEITPVGSAAISVDPLRYGNADPLPEGNGELAFLKLRYKNPGESTSNLITTPVRYDPDVTPDSEALFSVAVAGFGQLLRDDTRLGDWGFADVLEMAQANKGDDPFGYRSEFIRLVRLAETAQ